MVHLAHISWVLGTWASRVMIRHEPHAKVDVDLTATLDPHLIILLPQMVGWSWSIRSSEPTPESWIFLWNPNPCMQFQGKTESDHLPFSFLQQAQQPPDRSGTRTNAALQAPPTTVYLQSCTEALFRACLDWGWKLFGCHIGCVGRMSRGVFRN